jgi:N-acetyl-gamma-glutamyl-phosphate reductase
MLILFGREALASYESVVAPGTKGITTTIEISLNKGIHGSDILDAYKDFYKNNPFVEVFNNGMLNEVRSGFDRCFCKIGTSTEADSGKITVTTILDDAVRGVASQAVQTMNLMYGIDGAIGL